MMKTILSVVLSAVLAHAVIASQPLIEQLDVFASGTEGYHTFRIPTLVVSNRGTVLAICEGRKDSRQDLSNVHLMVKRSSDDGKTWGPLQLNDSDSNPNTDTPRTGWTGFRLPFLPFGHVTGQSGSCHHLIGAHA